MLRHWNTPTTRWAMAMSETSAAAIKNAATIRSISRRFSMSAGAANTKTT